MNPAFPSTINSERIQTVLYGFTKSQMLFTAVELKVFTQIAQGHNTPERMAAVLDVDNRSTRIFLDALIGIGFLTRNPDGTYGLPIDVDYFLTETLRDGRENPNYLGGMVMYGHNLSENWTLLSDVVRNGQPAGGAQTLADVESRFSELVKALYVSNQPAGEKLAHYLAFTSNQEDRPVKHILDVGGGSGVWSLALLDQLPEAEATLLDYPSVIPVSKQYVAQRGHTTRYHYLPGDVEIMQLPQGEFDLAILANICHLVGSRAIAELLQKISGALKPGGQLVIVDFVPDNQRSQPGWPLQFGLNMLINTLEGNVYTAEEYTKWLSQAHFTVPAQIELETAVSALIATKIEDANFAI